MSTSVRLLVPVAAVNGDIVSDFFSSVSITSAGILKYECAARDERFPLLCRETTCLSAKQLCINMQSLFRSFDWEVLREPVSNPLL